MNDTRSIRTPQEVGERIVALMTVIDKIYSGNNPNFLQWVEQNAVLNYLSADEKAFFETATPDEHTKIQFSWRAEALTALLWAANFIQEMPPLNSEFDILSIEALDQMNADPIAFIEQIQLRPHPVLETMAGELYNAHWQVRDAQLFDKEMPATLQPGIVYERRYALSWLVGDGEDWDNVPTDT